MSETTMIPVDVIAFDEMTAKAIRQHHAQGPLLVIHGRCYLTRRDVAGCSVVRLRVEAEQVLFVKPDVGPLAEPEAHLPLAS
jgi:hypothetical protein